MKQDITSLMKTKIVCYRKKNNAKGSLLNEEEMKHDERI